MNVYGKETVINSLKIKLAYLSSILNETKDLTKRNKSLRILNYVLKI